jgi:hypothetical protein
MKNPVELVVLAYRRGEQTIFSNSVYNCVLHSAVMHLQVSIFRQLNSLGISIHPRHFGQRCTPLGRLHWVPGAIQWLYAPRLITLR